MEESKKIIRKGLTVAVPILMIVAGVHLIKEVGEVNATLLPYADAVGVALKLRALQMATVLFAVTMIGIGAIRAFNQILNDYGRK